jgi:histone-lysine N-methyltransferase SETMAR
MVDFLPYGQTITGEYYAGLLRKLREKLREKRRGKLAKGVLLQHDNARVHTCKLSMNAISECGFELVPHPPYSPDLTPSDYHLFRFLKSDIKGRSFADNEEVIDFVEQWIQSKNEEFFSSGINELPKRRTKCIEIRGNYVEK